MVKSEKDKITLDSAVSRDSPVPAASGILDVATHFRSLRQCVMNQHPFKSIRLAPPGYPEILCRVCTNVKPPGQRCWDCFKDGRIYRGRVVSNPATRIKLKEKRAELIEKWKAGKKKWERTKFQRQSAKRKRALLRSLQVKTLDEAIERLMCCFGREPGGGWALYEERLPELTPLLDELHQLLPKVRKTYERKRQPSSAK